MSAIALMLILAACSSAGGEPTTTGASGEPSTSAAGPGTSTEPPATTTTTGSEVTETTSDRPLAPDFTLELGDGGVYTLSEGAQPVYLVFWAEW
jgi:hypothetical protein